MQEEKILGAFDKLLDKAEGKGDITGENLAQDLIQFGEDSGCTFSDQVNEALGQIREGADPIEVEKKLAGLLDEDGCSFDSGTVKIVKGGKKVEVDETLYDLHTNMK